MRLPTTIFLLTVIISMIILPPINYADASHSPSISGKVTKKDPVDTLACQVGAALGWYIVSLVFDIVGLKDLASKKGKTSKINIGTLQVLTAISSTPVQTLLNTLANTLPDETARFFIDLFGFLTTTAAQIAAFVIILAVFGVGALVTAAAMEGLKLSFFAGFTVAMAACPPTIVNAREGPTEEKNFIIPNTVFHIDGKPDFDFGDPTDIPECKYPLKIDLDRIHKFHTPELIGNAAFFTGDDPWGDLVDHPTTFYLPDFDILDAIVVVDHDFRERGLEIQNNVISGNRVNYEIVQITIHGVLINYELSHSFIFSETSLSNNRANTGSQFIVASEPVKPKLKIDPSIIVLEALEPKGSPVPTNLLQRIISEPGFDVWDDCTPQNEIKLELFSVQVAF